MDRADWVTLGVSLLAIAVALLSWWASHRSANAAERSANAAERQAALAEAEAERYQPPWEIEPAGQMRRLLLNRGDEDALDVSVEGDSIVVTGPAQHQWDHIGVGGSVEFYAARGINQVDDMVTVSWRESGGTSREWRCALP